MTNLNRSEDNDLLVALRHPLRRKILCEMDGKETISPRAVATAIKEPLTGVSYHVRVLADRSAVVLVDTKPVRGSMQHFYRATVRKPWARQALGLDPPEGGATGESSTDPKA